MLISRTYNLSAVIELLKTPYKLRSFYMYYCYRSEMHTSHVLVPFPGLGLHCSYRYKDNCPKAAAKTLRRSGNTTRLPQIALGSKQVHTYFIEVSEHLSQLDFLL